MTYDPSMTITSTIPAPEGSDRWETLLQEGCKQSGNPFLPKIAPPVKLAAALAEHGLLCLTAGPGRRLLPPLVISQEEMDKGLAILKNTLS